MMQTRRVLVIAMLSLFVGLVGIAGCGSTESDTDSAQVTDSEREEIASEIRQRNQDLLDAWAQQDAFDDWMELYVDEDHPAWIEHPFMLTVSGSNFDTRAEMDQGFRRALVDRTTQVQMLDESVAVLSEEAAVHFGDFTWTLTRGGRTSPKYKATATTVWAKDGDQWKLLTYHQSQPATAAALARKASAR